MVKMMSREVVVRLVTDTANRNGPYPVRVFESRPLSQPYMRRRSSAISSWPVL
jgi:hypothetical protein